MKKTKYLKHVSALFSFLLLAFSAQVMAEPATCDAPKIAVQSMAATRTQDIEATVVR